MTIAHPLAWGLLLLAVPIILFFFLKVRFRKEVTATMIFWQQVFEERRSRKLYPRFRSFLSLLFALLFLTFLTAATLDPTFFPALDNQCVIIIDNSASMNALLSDGTSRLESAKRLIRKQLDNLAAGQQIALLTASDAPQIISGFTNHERTLRRKLAEISGTDFPAELAAVVHLAERLVADHPRSPIYIYTDGNTASVSSNVHLVHIGTPIDNLAITRFQPRRLPEHVSDYEILVEVVNFGKETVQTQLEIDCNGKLVDVLPLALEPNMPVKKIIRNTSPRGGLFRATLTDTDMFPTDNVATAFLSEQYVQHILLYGQENYFLWHVLQVQPQTEVVILQEIPDSIPPDSVLVLHQLVPSTLPPGNVLVIDPQNGCDLFRVGETLELPMTAKVNEENPLVRFISPGILLNGAKRIFPQTSPPKNLLETAEEFPLYLQFVSENQRTLVFSADLNQGDFSLRTAFPILISQALAYFRNSEEMQKAYSTSESVKLTLQTEKSQIILRSPSGKEEVLPCQNGSATLGKLGKCGIWTILEPESGQELTQICCNLFNTTESNLRAVSETPAQPEINTAARFARPIWCYLALLALVLTITEWHLYQRRWIE
ncbi:MAG: BatA and WFA domain-containing protein [Planctomycetaceae bacterium]|jgi:hypothetical protein|nr:BatA and WFA domain-containing protein [Planctomycetaceae bacterium]